MGWGRCGAPLKAQRSQAPSTREEGRCQLSPEARGHPVNVWVRRGACQRGQRGQRGQRAKASEDPKQKRKQKKAKSENDTKIFKNKKAAPTALISILHRPTDRNHWVSVSPRTHGRSGFGLNKMDSLDLRMTLSTILILNSKSQTWWWDQINWSAEWRG